MQAIAPVLAGVAPFAVVIGATIGTAHVDRLAAWAGSFLICAGTAQLTAVQLLDRGAGPVAVVAAVVVINARFTLYSTALARWFAGEPLRRRLLLAFPLIDQLYAVCSARFDGRPTTAVERRAFYGAAAVVLLIGWTAVQGAAVALAGSLPDTSWLRPAAPLALAGVLAAGHHDRGTVAAALVAAAAAVPAAAVAGQGGPVLAISAGLGAGMFAGRSAS
jgi:predicted branched-subunit amino acid permease